MLQSTKKACLILKKPRKLWSLFLGKFSHIDINLMCCIHRLTDVRLEKILDIEELPNTKKYWELLKSRKSYQKCILDFYGEREKGDIKDVFG